MDPYTYVNTLAGDEDDDAILAGLAGEELGARRRARQRGSYGGGASYAPPLASGQRTRGAAVPGVGYVTQPGGYAGGIYPPAPMPFAAAQAVPPQYPGAPGAYPIAQLIPQIAGVPQRGLRKTWLPLGALAFIAGGQTLQALTARTQRPFRGTRMVFDTTRTGATATGLLTLVNVICGQDNQPAAQGAAPLGAFSPTAFDVDIDLDPIGPGVDFVAQVGVSANPTMTDRIDTSGVLFGYQIK